VSVPRDTHAPRVVHLEPSNWLELHESRCLTVDVARFYQANVGKAAGMQDMLDTILDEAGFDVTELANGWPRSMGRADR